MSETLRKLVYLANQIARNFEIQGETAAVAATAEHMAKFWDPRARSRGFALLDQPDCGLSLIAAAALTRLRDGASAKAQTAPG